jgi:hypothetical protein
MVGKVVRVHGWEGGTGSWLGRWQEFMVGMAIAHFLAHKACMHGKIVAENSTDTTVNGRSE